MNKFTKAQVIALLLATAKAQNCDGCADVTNQEVINSNSSLDTTADGTRSYQLTVPSSFEECAEDFDCEDDDEMCGTIIGEGMTIDQIPTGVCVYANECGVVGKASGVAFSVHCYDTDPVPDPMPDPLALLANIETIVTTDGAGSWDEVYNLKVPSLKNYQDGWWIRDDDTVTTGFIYTETDKPVNNKCTANSDCAADECCTVWPDTNNKRCQAATVDGELQTILPFASFTAVCDEDTVEEPTEAPRSAIDDLAAEAQAKAAEALTEFNALADETIKTNAGWYDMTTEEQEAWDEERAERIAARDEADALDKENAGYDDMSNDAKAVYDAEYLTWKKAWFKVCQEEPDSIECRKGREVRDADEVARKADGYYEKEKEDRDTFDEAQETETEKEKNALAVAWLDDNKPAAGEPGSGCGTGCTTDGHCCGTSTPKGNAAGVTDGQATNVCSATTGWTDGLGTEYTHVCAAKKLLATATALFAVAALM